MVYTVKKLASISGISVRTLHYYDEIGLLKPSFIQENGYRAYEEKEVKLLQQILFFKELEFSLEMIAFIIHAPDFDLKKALQDQQTLLLLKKQKLEAILTTITNSIISLEGGEKMKTDNSFGIQSQKQIDAYKKEAKERWGNTNAYKQSEERSKNWTKADYERITQEGKTLTKEIAAVMNKDVHDPEVQALIAKHFASLQQFYDVSYVMYKNLGDMYVSDPRFSAYYEAFAPGLAQFMKDAIIYFCKQ